MTISALGSPKSLLQFTAFAIPFLVTTLATTDASAQAGGPFQRYSERWYGQNFYDDQRTGLFDFKHRHQQHNAGFYGPAMMYSRQYGDEYGYHTAAPFRPPLANGGISYGGGTYSY